MHLGQLLLACTDLVSHVMRFEHPVDKTLTRFFPEHRLRQRERATSAETVYLFLRQSVMLGFMARSEPQL